MNRIQAAICWACPLKRERYGARGVIGAAAAMWFNLGFVTLDNGTGCFQLDQRSPQKGAILASMRANAAHRPDLHQDQAGALWWARFC